MDKILFTPGPLTTSSAVKQKMMRDLGSRDTEFMEIIKDVLNGILKVSNLSKNDGWEAILMQGSGTFGIEAVVSSVIPSNGKLLIVSNGAYGKNMSKMCLIHHINHLELSFSENQIPNINRIIEILENDKSFTHLAVVHCETTTGILNPIKEIGNIAHNFGLEFIVDAMSSFGGIPINFDDCKIDYLISSSNKCIESVPGFSFIITKKELLLKNQANARTFSLDIFDQWKRMEKTGQFRFTPPIHSILAFHQALIELEQEGGVSFRAKRYSNNHNQLINGMKKIGFDTYIAPEYQSYIITTFLYPNIHLFDFQIMYKYLSERNIIIYPGKLTEVNTFRIGTIGKITYNDINKLLESIESYCNRLR